MRIDRNQSMIGPDEALDRVLENVSKLPARPVALEGALNLKLAEDLSAPFDIPTFDRSMMDGFAVQRKSGARWAVVTGTLAAGEVRTTPLAPGTAVEIATGAPCPTGTEFVVPYEDATRDGERIYWTEDPEHGQYIVPLGSECRKGDPVLTRGLDVTPLVISVLASFGKTEASVVPSPRMAILITGNEVVRSGLIPGPGQIADANGPLLCAMAREQGVSDIRLLWSEDHLDRMVEILERTEETEIVLVSGGVSRGPFDLVPQALRKTGAEILFHKVSQKPGKPMLFARKGSLFFFGLPGNPLSAHLGFHRYVAPAIRIMQGRSFRRLRGRGKSSLPTQTDDRTRFDLVWASGDQTGETTVFTGRNSSDLFSVCAANGILERPPETGNASIKESGEIEFEWMGNRWEER